MIETKVPDYPEKERLESQRSPQYCPSHVKLFLVPGCPFYSLQPGVYLRFLSLCPYQMFLLLLQWHLSSIKQEKS
ncbi:MAG: hypothetical protein ACI4AA_05910 [Lachnospiraceae bacterium]